MVSGGRSASSRMMDGILSAMISGSRSVYNKAAEIANTVARTMRNALQVRSPSRVMVDIFKNVMLGIVGGLDSLKSLVYSDAANIAAGISQRLTITPELAGITNSTLLSVSSAALHAPAALMATTSSGGSYAAPAGTDGLLQKAVTLLDQYLPVLASMKVVLDSGKTVGELAPAMDDALGKIARQKERAGLYG